MEFKSDNKKEKETTYEAETLDCENVCIIGMRQAFSQSYYQQAF